MRLLFLEPEIWYKTAKLLKLEFGRCSVAERYRSYSLLKPEVIILERRMAVKGSAGEKS